MLFVLSSFDILAHICHRVNLGSSRHRYHISCKPKQSFQRVLQIMNLCGGCGSTTGELRKTASYSDSVFQLPPAITSRSSDDSLAAQVPNLTLTPRRANTPHRTKRIPEDVCTPVRTVMKTPMRQTSPSSHMTSATPSPGLLNPLEWKDLMPNKKKIFCPTLDRFTTLDSLVKRLEAGFAVVRAVLLPSCCCVHFD